MATMKVKPWGEGQGDHVLINEDDFDPDVHVPFDVSEPAKPVEPQNGDPDKVGKERDPKDPDNKPDSNPEGGGTNPAGEGGSGEPEIKTEADIAKATDDQLRDFLKGNGQAARANMKRDSLEARAKLIISGGT